MISTTNKMIKHLKKIFKIQTSQYKIQIAQTMVTRILNHQNLINSLRAKSRADLTNLILPENKQTARRKENRPELNQKLDDRIQEMADPMPSS